MGLGLMVPEGDTMAPMDELPAMCPASKSMGQSAGNLNQCWIRNGYAWCSREVAPAGIGLCAEHLKELRSDA